MIKTLRQKLRKLEWESEQLEQTRTLWMLKQHEDCCSVLENHRLAGDAQSIRAARCLMVIESAQEADDAKHDQAACGAREAEQLVSAGAVVRGDWETLTTSAGRWAVRPSAEGVVLLTAGFVSTDADDDQAIDAALKAARLLPFKSPLVLTRQELASRAQERLDKLDLGWADHAPGTATKRLRPGK